MRGAALLGVLFFHANGALPGGYLGVDLFFVLSGFLITSLLLAEHRDTGRIGLSNFWVRRARRLFPALLSIMPAIAIYGRFFAKPDELQTLRADAFATLGYVANWRAIFSHKSYWELFAAPSPLEHTWSLAIEEQFYVVWPLVVVLVLRRFTSRAILGLSLVLSGLSVAAMILLLDRSGSSRVYLGTDTRAAAILLGAAFATVFSQSTKLSDSAVRKLDALGLVAVVGLGIAWAKLDGESRFLYRGGFWLTEIAALVLIACAVLGTRSIVGRALSFRPLALIGTISYGVYLWHWPVNVVMSPERMHMTGVWLHVMQFAITFAVSIVSYRVLERPIRTNGLPFGRPIYIVPAAVALSLLLVVRATYARKPVQNAPLAVRASNAVIAMVGGKVWPSVFSVDRHTLPPASELRPGTLRILTIGDSVACFLGQSLRYQQETANAFVAEQGVGDCSIMSGPNPIHAASKDNKLPDQGTNCAKDWIKDVGAVRPDVTLVVLGGAFYGNGVLESDGTTCAAGWRKDYRERLVSLLDTIAPDAGRIVLTIVPYPMGRWRYKGVMARVDCFNETLAEVARARNLQTIDLKSYVCPTKECTMFSKNEPVRPDGLHFDGVGSEETAQWALKAIRALTDVDASPATGVAATP